MDIFVGSLPFKLKETELRAMFEKYGEVSRAKIIIDRITRQNKGFGFIEMPDEEQAKHAIKELNGFEIDGRKIVVNKPDKKETDTDKRTGSKGSKGDKSKGSGYKGSFNKGGKKGGRFGYLSYE